MISSEQNFKQWLQIEEALHIRNKNPNIKNVTFKTNANVFKCLKLLFLSLKLNFTSINKALYCFFVFFLHLPPMVIARKESESISLLLEYLNN